MKIKNNIKKISAILLAMAMCTPCYADRLADIYRVDDRVDETIPVNVEIDETNIICEASDKMLGVQYEHKDNRFGLVEDENSTDIAPGYIKMVEDGDFKFKIPLGRLGGTTGEFTIPIYNVGPLKTRKKSFRNADAVNDPGAPTYGPQPFGAVEWIKLIQATKHPEPEFMPVISMTVGTPEEHAQFAQFLTDEKNESKWGALRASLGIEKPVKVYAYELGNECDSDQQIGIDWYTKVATKVIAAIKAVDPDAKFMLTGKTVPDFGPGPWQQWTLQIAERFKDDADYMSFHQYYSGYHMSYTRVYREILYEDLMSVSPHFKISITEHAKWGTGESSMYELQSALATGMFLARMYRRPEVESATYHCACMGDGWWGLYQTNMKQYWPTPIGTMYGVYQEHVGDRVVWTKMTSETNSDYVNPQSGGERFNLVAFARGKRELELIFTNYTEHVEFPLNIKFKNNYTLESSTVFTGCNFTSAPMDPDTLDCIQTNVDKTKVKNFSSITVPPKCMMFLKLTSDKDLPQLGAKGSSGAAAGELVYTGDKFFEDVEYSFAKNEILTLCDSGVINGVSETKFAPKSTLTRAQLAAMLVRLVGKEEATYNNLFTDVSANDWYAGSVAAAYGEGMIKGIGGGRFNPNANITMEELVTIVSRVHKGYKTDADDKVNLSYLNSFKNKDDISSWAKEEIAYAVEKGLISSMYENGNFIPKENALREHAASIMYKLYSALQ